MRRPPLLIWTLAGLLVPVLAKAQDLPVLKAGPVEEFFTESVPVSGATRAGVVAGRLDRPSRPGVLHVYVPARIESHLCVEISSRDGRYGARFEVTERPVARGIYEVVFETKFANRLKEGKGVYLAALATLREDCGGPIEGVLITSWERSFSPRSFTVLVNAGRLETTLVLETGSGEEKRVPCRLIEDDPKIAFDSQCDAKLDNLGIEDSVTGAWIERRRMLSILPRIALPLML